MEQLLFGLIIYSGKKKGCGGHVYLLQWAPCKLPTEFKLKNATYCLLKFTRNQVGTLKPLFMNFYCFSSSLCYV